MTYQCNYHDISVLLVTKANAAAADDDDGDHAAAAANAADADYDGDVVVVAEVQLKFRSSALLRIFSWEADKCIILLRCTHSS